MNQTLRYHFVPQRKRIFFEKKEKKTTTLKQYLPKHKLTMNKTFIYFKGDALPYNTLIPMSFLLADATPLHLCWHDLKLSHCLFINVHHDLKYSWFEISKQFWKKKRVSITWSGKPGAVFVSASHPRGLDTTSMTWRSIIVGIRGM